MTVHVSDMSAEQQQQHAPPPNKLANGGATAAATATATHGGGGDGVAEMGALCLRLKDKVDRFLAMPTDSDAVLKGTQKQVRVACGVIDESLQRYRPEELALSYNGGKDCLVLLVLILAQLASRFASASASASSSEATPTPTPNASTTSTTSPSPSDQLPPALQALYIRPPSPFPEVDTFVSTSTVAYRLDLAVSDKPMKAALADYLATRPRIRAVFVGTRRTDPHGAALSHFDETDRDWPRFMRVHPVIDWHYREVWGFIRALEIPYCPLYDMGYTSLGGTNDTSPNPALKRDGGDGEEEAFRPAYELIEDEEERLGRDS